jgi:epoxyqueuosine reductase
MDESAELHAWGSVRVLPAPEVRAAARACGFALVGLARAEPLDPRPLVDWLARGYAAGLRAMHQRIPERLDPAAVVPLARTVLVLGIPYGKGDTAAPPAPAIARYARGRDYHYAHRDRMRKLRESLREIEPALRTYACVDSGAAMEKAWAERAGLGFIGKNGLVISRSHGSWFTLSLMVLDRAVDAYDSPHHRLCGDCRKCLDACPTEAFPSPGVVDARRCLSYHTVENHGDLPAEVRPKLGPRVFGCDACQEVCPFNQGDLPPGDPRQAPRALGHLRAAEIAALTEAQFDELSTGTPMRRIRYDGLRRNACLALGATRGRNCQDLLERLANDPSPSVAEAANWALREIGMR